MERVLDLWVLEGKLQLDSVKTTSSLDSEDKHVVVQYQFTSAPGVSVFARIYKFGAVDPEYYVLIESGLTIFQGKGEEAVMLYNFLLQKNSGMAALGKLSLNQDVIAYTWRSSLENTTGVQLQQIVSDWLGESEAIMNELQRRFHLQPIYEQLRTRRSAH